MTGRCRAAAAALDELFDELTKLAPPLIAARSSAVSTVVTGRILVAFVDALGC